MTCTIRHLALYALPALLLYACSAPPPVETPAPPPDPVVLSYATIRLTDPAYVNHSLAPDSAVYMSVANFWLRYIGKMTPHITLSEELVNKAEWINQYDQRKKSVTNIEIHVDTNSRIAIPSMSAMSSHIQQNTAYPVYIYNKAAQDTVYVGVGEAVDMVIEAKDSSGVWRPIQYPFNYFCSTGLAHIGIPPQQVLITGCKHFVGNYLTEMRLQLHFNEVKATSNVFKGRMQYSQFSYEPQ